MKDKTRVLRNVISKNLEARGKNGITSYLHRWTIHEHDKDAVCRLTWRQVSKLLLYIGDLEKALYDATQNDIEKINAD